MTRRELWESLSKEAQDFAKAMKQAGFTFKSVKSEKGEWVK